jgi:hypothetical protein
MNNDQENTNTRPPVDAAIILDEELLDLPFEEQPAHVQQRLREMGRTKETEK